MYTSPYFVCCANYKWTETTGSTGLGGKKSHDKCSGCACYRACPVRLRL